MDHVNIKNGNNMDMAGMEGMAHAISESANE